MKFFTKKYEATLEEKEEKEEKKPGENSEPVNYAELNTLVGELILLLKKFLSEEKESESEGAGTESTISPIPSMYQEQEEAIKYLKSLETRMAMLEQKKDNDIFDGELRAMCAENSTINYQATSAVLQKFPDAQSKKIFLESVKTMLYQDATHPATQYLANFKRISVVDALAKYQKEDARIQQIAKRAYCDYYDTAGQANLKNATDFLKTWGDNVEKFVDAAVNGEKDMPGYYDTVLANSH